MRHTILFTLSMPGVGSSTPWTGSGNSYTTSRVVGHNKFRELFPDTAIRNFHYDFGDGWRASVRATPISSKEAAQAKKTSKGFAGYEWMVVEILELGRIKTREERLIKVQP